MHIPKTFAMAGKIVTDHLYNLVTATITRLCHTHRPVAQATAIADIPEHDSFKMVELVLEIEHVLGREVDFARLENVQSVQDIAAAFQTNVGH